MREAVVVKECSVDADALGLRAPFRDERPSYLSGTVSEQVAKGPLWEVERSAED